MVASPHQKYHWNYNINLDFYCALIKVLRWAYALIFTSTLSSEQNAIIQKKLFSE